MPTPIEKLLLTLSAFILVTLMPSWVLAAEEGTSSGAAASDPTAAVNYQDVRYRYFDLESGDKNSFETEGAFMLSPRLKITNELRYVETDSSGKSEQDFEQLKLKAILLTNGMPFGVKAKYAVGVEWQKDLGDLKEGTGTGADIIAPLVGIGWVPNDKNFIITLLQYYHSYDTDSDRKDDVRETGPRLIWIRSIPDINGWFKADLKMSINHEDDNDFSQTLELQLGKMFSSRVGGYAEILLGDDVMDTNAYDIGGGLVVRFMY
jgi:hypothetical protein